MRLEIAWELRDRATFDGDLAVLRYELDHVDRLALALVQFFEALRALEDANAPDLGANDACLAAPGVPAFLPLVALRQRLGADGGLLRKVRPTPFEALWLARLDGALADRAAPADSAAWRPFAAGRPVIGPGSS